VAGVSGGADSMALLHILVRAGYDCVVAHCNFHLRGEESDGDAVFVEQTAASLHLPFFSMDFDTTGYAVRQGISVEMAARELRYRWFEELRQTLRAQAIAVAHHRDDSLETLLLNLIRGTGIRGLCGIRPKNGYIVRPLLNRSHREIREWLSQQDLIFRTDSTNFSDKHMRNVIRLHLLPLMERLNPSVRDAILRTAEHLSGVESLYENCIEKERAHIMPDGKCIDIRKLMQSPSPQTVLYELIRPFGFTRSVAASVFASIYGDKSGKIFFAPDSDYRIVKDRVSLLVVARQMKDECEYTVGMNDSLTYPIRLTTKKTAVVPGFCTGKSRSEATFDMDKLSFPLTLRRWREGDSFIPFGMLGRKKLSDYFIDRKFSLVQKEQTWLLCCAENIIWVVGERIDNRYRVHKSTKFALIVHFFRS
jgi:tRNA(Ile)-lysidine synthase